MKKLIIVFVLFILLPLYSKDYHKTVEMIKSILNEETDAENSNSEQKVNNLDEKKQDDKTKEETKKKDESEDSKNKNNAMSGKDEVLLKTGIQLYESGLFDHSLVQIYRFN